LRSDWYLTASSQCLVIALLSSPAATIATLACH